MTEEQENHSAAGEMSVGTRLREAREAAGLSRADIAARTRITERHIAAIEADDFAALAGRTYAIGFSRNYAKAVGLDPAAVAEAVRQQSFQADATGDAAPLDDLEPGDPSRVPTRSTAWLAGLGAFAVVIAGFFAWRTYHVPEMSLPTLTPEEVEAPAVASSPVQPGAQRGGAVVFTALEDGIWVKFYDASGAQLMQKQMAKGETYTVPADANGPQVWTGRPEALAITIGGKPVPPLADRQMTIKDVGVSADALLGRSASAVTPAPAPVATLAVPKSNPVPVRRRQEPAGAPMLPPPSPAAELPPAAEALPTPDSTVSD